MSRAKTLNKEQYQSVVALLDKVSSDPLRDRVILAATFKAGLRIAEVAGLRWQDVCNPMGALTQGDFEVPNGIAKKGSGRELHMHPALFEALLAYRSTLPIARASGKAPLLGEVYRRNTLQRRINRMYRALGLVGVTTHSGRRSCLTALARMTSKFECSLKDVQYVAGHKNIDTTEAYIERSSRMWEMMEAV